MRDAIAYNGTIIMILMTILIGIGQARAGTIRRRDWHTVAGPVCDSS